MQWSSLVISRGTDTCDQNTVLHNALQCCIVSTADSAVIYEAGIIQMLRFRDPLLPVA